MNKLRESPQREAKKQRLYETLASVAKRKSFKRADVRNGEAMAIRNFYRQKLLAADPMGAQYWASSAEAGKASIVLLIGKTFNYRTLTVSKSAQMSDA